MQGRDPAHDDGGNNPTANPQVVGSVDSHLIMALSCKKHSGSNTYSGTHCGSQDTTSNIVFQANPKNLFTSDPMVFAKQFSA